MSLWLTLRDRYSVAGDPLRTERRIELVALALFVLFCLQLVYSLIRFTVASGPDALAPAGDALQLGSLEYGRSLVQRESEEIRSRPLFWQSRRPQAAVQSPLESETERGSAAELKGVKLKGVFGSGDTAGIIALVKDKKQRILLGEELQGWTLDSVAPDGVTLVSGGRSQELRLKTAAVIAAQPVKQSVEPKPATKERSGSSQKESGSGAAKPPETVSSDRRGVPRR